MRKKSVARIRRRGTDAIMRRPAKHPSHPAGAPTEGVRWVIICYVLTYAITSFAGGAAADRIGHVAVFRAGIALSVVAFVMGGAAGSFEWLLVARVVQGFAGGLIYGTAPALATLGAPAEARGRRLGFLSAAMGLGLLGSLPAGALVESFGWRAVYHVRVPAALAVAGFGLGFFEVPNMATIMAAFPSSRQGTAGGLSFLARTLGVVAGVAVTGQIVASRSAAVGFLGAFAESLLVAALAVAAASAFALVGTRPRR